MRYHSKKRKKYGLGGIKESRFLDGHLVFCIDATPPLPFRVERATRKNSQLAPARRVALKMGRRSASLVGYISIQICTLLAPCRRPILNATTSPLFVRRCTRKAINFSNGRWVQSYLPSERELA